MVSSSSLLLVSKSIGSFDLFVTPIGMTVKSPSFAKLVVGLTF